MYRTSSILRGRMRERPGRPSSTGIRAVTICLALGLLALDVGCSVRDPFTKLFGAREGSPARRDSAATSGDFYAAIDGVKLYAKPLRSSAVVGTLALHQKVRRDALERGFAHVRVEETGQTGWVDNAKLTWKVPASPTRPSDDEATDVPRPAEPSEGASSEAPLPEAPPPRAAPVETPRPEPAAASPELRPKGSASTTNPTVFDPF